MAKGRESDIKEGKDYTIKDGKLIIDKDKLKELGEIGTKAEITVVDGKGTTLKFTIKVTDTPRISAPTASGNSFVFNIAGYGNELRLIKLTDGEKTLKDFRIVSDINVRNGKFTLDSTAFNSLADGNYTLTATFDTGEKVSFTIIKKGDKIQFINADLADFSLTGGTKPNTKDCLYFLEIFIGKRAYNGENLDFNADGKVNTLDVLVLLDFVVSM